MSPPFPRRRSGLHDAIVGAKFDLRQGLWTEDLRTPPEQECSNGSLILLAVVLWRTFFTCHPKRPRGTSNFTFSLTFATVRHSDWATMKLLKVKTGRFTAIVEKCG